MTVRQSAAVQKQLPFPAAAVTGQTVTFAGVAASSVSSGQVKLFDTEGGDRRRTLEALLDSTREQTFEYGMMSSFDSHLTALLTAWGADGLRRLSELLLQEARVPKEAAVESLAVVGRGNNIASSEDRLQFLEGFLAHPLASMRDAAGLALLELHDRRALATLREAIAMEPNPQLRRNLESVISELQA